MSKDSVGLRISCLYRFEGSQGEIPGKPQTQLRVRADAGGRPFKGRSDGAESAAAIETGLCPAHLENCTGRTFKKLFGRGAGIPVSGFEDEQTHKSGYSFISIVLGMEL